MQNTQNHKIPNISLFSIKDVKVPKFFPPFQAENEQVALRQFYSALKPGSFMSENAADYELYQLADFCQQTGSIIPSQSPIFIVNGVELINEGQDPIPTHQGSPKATHV